MVADKKIPSTSLPPLSPVSTAHNSVESWEKRSRLAAAVCSGHDSSRVVSSALTALIVALEAGMAPAAQW